MRDLLAIAAFVLLVCGLLTAAAIRHERERARCTDNGGTWMRVNCRLVEDQNCITTDYGSGMVITSCMPSMSEVCDQVCRGARAEVSP